MSGGGLAPARLRSEVVLALREAGRAIRAVWRPQDGEVLVLLAKDLVDLAAAVARAETPAQLRELQRRARLVVHHAALMALRRVHGAERRAWARLERAFTRAALVALGRVLAPLLG